MAESNLLLAPGSLHRSVCFFLHICTSGGAVGFGAIWGPAEKTYIQPWSVVKDHPHP